MGGFEGRALGVGFARGLLDTFADLFDFVCAFDAVAAV